MKILLVGEFSGVHNQLMDQLIKQGHKCDLLSDGDGWKKFSNTISLPERKKLTRLDKLLFPVLDFFGISGINEYIRNRKSIHCLKGYDVVQFINPISIKSFGAIGNLLLFKYILKNNHRTYLCALGGDYNVEKLYLSKKLKYSPWSNISLKSFYYYYQNISFFFPSYIILHFYFRFHVHKIIPGLYEYKQAYAKEKKCTDIINLPINTSLYNRELPPSNKIVKVFYSKKPHKGDFYKKGYNYFDEAIDLLLKEKVPFELVTANGVSFSEYNRMLADCDILLDQTLSYDRGMSGIIGMANGMITFSGNEPVVEEYYGHNIPCINALPDANYIFMELKEVILNIHNYNQFRKDSIQYINKYHSVENVTNQYLKIWGE